MNWHRANNGQEFLYDDRPVVPFPRAVITGGTEVVIYDDGYHPIRRRVFQSDVEARAWAEAENQWTALDRLR